MRAAMEGAAKVTVGVEASMAGAKTADKKVAFAVAPVVASVGTAVDSVLASAPHTHTHPNSQVPSCSRQK